MSEELALLVNETENLVQEDTGNGFVFSGYQIPEDESIGEEALALVPLKAEISEMTYTGQMILEFNTPLKDVPLEDIDETQINLELNIMDLRNFDEGFDLKKLDFHFEPVYLKGTTLIL